MLWAQGSNQASLASCWKNHSVSGSCDPISCTSSIVQARQNKSSSSTSTSVAPAPCAAVCVEFTDQTHLRVWLMLHIPLGGPLLPCTPRVLPALEHVIPPPTLCFPAVAIVTSPRQGKPLWLTHGRFSLMVGFPEQCSWNIPWID